MYTWMGGTAVIYFATVCIRWQCSQGFIMDEDGSDSQQLDVAVRRRLLTSTVPDKSVKWSGRTIQIAVPSNIQAGRGAGKIR